MRLLFFLHDKSLLAKIINFSKIPATLTLVIKRFFMSHRFCNPESWGYAPHIDKHFKQVTV